MKRRILCWLTLAGLLGLLLLCGGCWNYHELDELSIVSGVGLDQGKRPGTVELTVQIIKPGEVKSGGEQGGGGGGGGGKQPPFIVKTIAGKTVFEAIRNSLRETNRKLYFPHNQLIVIGKEQAEHGVRTILDLFIRDHEPRPTVWVLVAEGKAKDILKAPGELEKISAMEISELVQIQTATSENIIVKLQDFIVRLMSNTTAPVAPMIRINEQSKEKRLSLTGTAVFKEDRLRGKLDTHQTRGLLWVLGKVKSGIIMIRVPQGEAGMEIIRASSEIKPIFEKGRLKIRVTVREEGNLGCQMTPAELTKPAMLKSLARRKAALIRREIYSALKQAKAMKTDIFGFGDAVHRSHPKQWQKMERQWDEIFPQLPVEVDVRSVIKLVGLTTKPAVPVQD
ncbi:spore germination protein KC [Hydrogenispora ethanolica]|jgi:spore germination protein KC|uniref:Spore germination protein KC n=1 Tax=Hydrogenispora ethanolica TaxID=1082276 RepID=A0A4R1REC2_HYDET|nr:Ger(x)C family spore germination protein [Hydrogenispora ethanolica]TCL64264.1 spore germination protein KC [Hydrogenispora ethanolica]